MNYKKISSPTNGCNAGEVYDSYLDIDEKLQLNITIIITAIIIILLSLSLLLMLLLINFIF